MFVATGVGPYSGQSVHFRNFAPEKIAYAINRYAPPLRSRQKEIHLGDVYTISIWRLGRRALPVSHSLTIPNQPPQPSPPQHQTNPPQHYSLHKRSLHYRPVSSPRRSSRATPKNTPLLTPNYNQPETRPPFTPAHPPRFSAGPGAFSGRRRGLAVDLSSVFRRIYLIGMT